VVKHIRQFSAELQNALGILEAEDRKRLQALLDDAKENRDKLKM
jgi:prephenate dehydrogenase